MEGESEMNNNAMYELAIVLKQYLQSNMQPKSVLDNIVEYAIPIIGILAIVVGGGWTVYTYREKKNKEEIERILKEVYLPLFQFFVTNDTLAQINSINISYKIAPFYEWKIVETEEYPDGTKGEKTSEILGMSRSSLVEQMNKINLGLAPEELVALITSYKAVICAIENFGKEGEKAKSYRKRLEYALRIEAYEGYRKYHEKLGIKRQVQQDVFAIYDDCIKLFLE